MAESDNVVVADSPAVQPPSRLRVALDSVVKLGLVAAIFGYLIYKKRIQGSDVRELAERWPWALLALALYMFTAAVCALRYKLLLRALDVSARYREILPISLIGMFFDLIAIGTGGDLVKAYYI